MEAKIISVGIVVSDQARSLEFYTERVGFEIKTDVTPKGGTRYVTVGPQGEGLELLLWPLDGTADPSQKEAAQNWSPGRSPPIALRVSDCRGLHRELSARGVEFLQAPLVHPWGISATFADPDGNLFSLNQPPSATAWGKS